SCAPFSEQKPHGREQPMGAKTRWMALLVLSVAVRAFAHDDDDRRLPREASFSTLITTPLQIEGMTGDNRGNLYVPGRGITPGDGTTRQGRTFMITPQGVVTEVFRIQPMANEVNLIAGVGGVGRDVRTLPPGTIAVTPTTRNAANTLGSQPLVANGLAFDKDG